MIPSDYGYAYRRAVLHNVPSEPRGLGWVLLDRAFAVASLTFDAGRRALMDEAALRNTRAFERARAKLHDAHLLTWETEGQGRGARTTYQLPTLEQIGEHYPEVMEKATRRRPLVGDNGHRGATIEQSTTATEERPLEGAKRPPEWPPERPPERSPWGGHESRSRSKTSMADDLWIPNLSSYTGARLVRGSHGTSYVYDPLGTAQPPVDWPHPRPTRSEVARALAEQP